jgi:hypothetical protein
MADKIFRDYTQEELDLQYTNLVTDHDRETQQDLQARSEAFADARADKRDLAYGDDPDNRFDLYRAGPDPSPAIILPMEGNGNAAMPPCPLPGPKPQSRTTSRLSPARSR